MDTLTDISSYLNLLFATAADAGCPYSGDPVPVRTGSQILESILSLPAGAEIELRAPVFEIYGEETEVLLNEVRRKENLPPVPWGNRPWGQQQDKSQ